MDSLLSIFLLFIAGITALLTYLVVPYVPVVTLVSAAAIVLAAGIWWHWTQFAVDYRASTWQEQLRNNASYAMVAVVILFSYAFYAIMLNDIPMPRRNAGNSRSNSIFQAPSPTNASALQNVKNISQNVSQNIQQGFNQLLGPVEPARTNIFA
jgi:hypothetical protein